MTVVLASGSETRRRLLVAAGVDILVRPADVDERAAERPLLDAGASPGEVAAALAGVKAISVSERVPDALVIGADQTLDLEGERFTKPIDADEARRQLLRLSGRTHQLHSALACARRGELIWQYVDTAALSMRRLTPGDIGRYVAEAGPGILGSVGAYQIEGRGIQLFDRVEGDYFTVLGLPLLPLLAFLRQEGVLP